MFARNFRIVSRSAVLCRQNVSNYSQAKQAQTYRRGKKPKSKADQAFELQKSMNPYVQNVGLSRQLKVLGLNSDDPTFKSENVSEALGDLDQSLEEFRDRSSEFRRQYEADQEELAVKAKRRIVYKSMFRSKPPPPLLTWLEREMIKYLHKQDSVEWSIERLSECFPATGSVIHQVKHLENIRNQLNNLLQVLRSRSMCDEDKISKYNKEVTNNWKLLSRGKLEISPDYENHLKSGYKTLSISSGLKNLAEQEIMVELEKKVSALPKPAIPGEFASIIIDYNKNLAKKKEEEQAELEQTEIDHEGGRPDQDQENVVVDQDPEEDEKAQGLRSDSAQDPSLQSRDIPSLSPRTRITLVHQFQHSCFTQQTDCSLARRHDPRVFVRGWT